MKAAFNIMRTVIFPAEFESLDEIREFVGQAASEAGFDSRSIYAVQLATDEACSNIIEHAYGDENNGKIECTCNLSETELVIILRDHGKPFDIESVADPDLTQDLDQRRVGGLGVYLMRKMVDEVKFECSEQAGNVLTLVKRREAVGDEN